jgi:hypothetical protein
MADSKPTVLGVIEFDAKADAPKVRRLFARSGAVWKAVDDTGENSALPDSHWHIVFDGKYKGTLTSRYPPERGPLNEYGLQNITSPTNAIPQISVDAEVFSKSFHGNPSFQSSGL